MVFGGRVRASGTPEGLRAQESGGWISAIVSMKRKARNRFEWSGVYGVQFYSWRLKLMVLRGNFSSRFWETRSLPDWFTLQV